MGEPSSPAGHRGVAEEDPRNAGPIEFFRPRRLTRASILETLAPYYRDRTVAELLAKADAIADKAAREASHTAPPLSQALEAVADPVYGLGVHPDIIAELWRLDRALPRSCRWVLWGKPALVHPVTGVVFAVGYGNIAPTLRLPPDILAEAPPERVKIVCGWMPGQRFDISPAGPEWRFVFHPVLDEWAQAGFGFAGAGG